MILKKTAAAITALFIAGTSIMPALAFNEVHKGDWSGTTGVSTFNAQEVERISKEELKLKETSNESKKTEPKPQIQAATDNNYDSNIRPGSVSSVVSSSFESLETSLIDLLFKMTPLIMIPFILLVVIKAFRGY